MDSVLKGGIHTTTTTLHARSIAERQSQGHEDKLGLLFGRDRPTVAHACGCRPSKAAGPRAVSKQSYTADLHASTWRQGRIQREAGCTWKGFTLLKAANEAQMRGGIGKRWSAQRS